MLDDIEQLTQVYLCDPLDFVSERFIYEFKKYHHSKLVLIYYLTTVRQVRQINNHYNRLSFDTEFHGKLKLNKTEKLYEDKHSLILIAKVLKC